MYISDIPVDVSPITFEVVTSIPDSVRCEFESCSGEVYSIQHYVIKFVSDLR
jgi:hypothetical protein